MAFLDKSQEESERNEIEREELRQRELAQAQALAKAQEDRAEAEKLRGEDQAHSAYRLRKMLTGLAVTTCAALIFLFIAIIAKQATEEAKEEVEIKIIDLAKKIEPIYEVFKGWNESTVGVTSLERLPKNAISYIKAIEKSVGCPAFIISTSPDRDDIIEVQNLKVWYPIKKGFLRKTVDHVKAINDLSFTLKELSLIHI